MTLKRLIDNNQIQGIKLNFKFNRNSELEIIVECIDIFETRFDMETKSYIQRLRF